MTDKLTLEKIEQLEADARFGYRPSLDELKELFALARKSLSEGLVEEVKALRLHPGDITTSFTKTERAKNYNEAIDKVLWLIRARAQRCDCYLPRRNDCPTPKPEDCYFAQSECETAAAEWNRKCICSPLPEPPNDDCPIHGDPEQSNSVSAPPSPKRDEKIGELVKRGLEYAANLGGNPQDYLAWQLATALQQQSEELERVKAQVDRFADGVNYEQRRNREAQARIASLLETCELAFDRLAVGNIEGAKSVLHGARESADRRSALTGGKE